MKSTVQEIFFIRAVACLCVVLIHALTVVVWNFPPASEHIRSLMMTGQLLLMFATPIFVFISEFILSYNGKMMLSLAFFRKRVQFILIPFILMAVFYAWITMAPEGIKAVEARIWENLFLARYHGYFILIIFQFYLLHTLFARLLASLPPGRVILISLAVNAGYLSFFNFTEPQLPANVWRFLYWIPFPGWLIYFVIGFYAGLYFDSFTAKIKKQKILIPLSWLLCAAAVIAVYDNGFLTEISSKRVDVMIFTISTILLLFQAGLLIKQVPPWVVLVSQYSFGIYLLHPFAQKIIQWWVKPFDWSERPALLALLLWLGGVLIPISLTYLLNKTAFGPYLVGKIGIKQKKSAA